MGCTTSATASGSSNRLVLRQAMASMRASIGCHGRFLPGIESAILSPRSGGLYNHLNRMLFYSQHCGGQRLIEPGAGPLAQFVTLGYLVRCLLFRVFGFLLVPQSCSMSCRVLFSWSCDVTRII